MPKTRAPKQDFETTIAAAYAAQGATLELGKGVLDGKVAPSAVVQIPLRMMTRHGLVAGATGTGKTKGLQSIAEQLSEAGVSVFAADMKGDFSGISEPGGETGIAADVEGAWRGVQARRLPGRVSRGRRYRARHSGARDRVRFRPAPPRQGATGERDAGAEPLARSSATPTRRGCRSSISPTCARSSPSSPPSRARQSSPGSAASPRRRSASCSGSSSSSRTAAAPSSSASRSSTSATCCGRRRTAAGSSRASNCRPCRTSRCSSRRR